MDSAAHFDIIADKYERLRPVYMPVMDTLAKVLEIGQNNTVIDFGCGPGHDIHYLTEKYKINPIAVDKSEKMCSVASSKIGGSNVVNSDNLSCLQNVQFDKIYFKFVMHHITQPIQFIDYLVNLLKKGAAFAIVTMMPSHLDSYELLNFFPSLHPILKAKALEQQECFDCLWRNKQITFNCIECNVNEEIFDYFLLNKLENNYSSFFSILSEEEKRQGIERVKNQIDLQYNHKYITKGIIGYGRKQ